MSTIRDGGISGDFIHEPLSEPQAQIRLIQIDLSSDDGESEIDCIISAHPLQDSPPYVAISYTWGDGSVARGICVNGRRLNIGHNSWLALWQARLHRVLQPLRIWMDVLSIDQANDAEKSIQVGLMGAIYDAAKYVLASMGAHEDDSEHLADQVEAHNVYLRNLRVVEGQKRDPAVERFWCLNCGKLLLKFARECSSCVNKGVKYEPLFCYNCANEHYKAGCFRITQISLMAKLGRHCYKCYRGLPFRWYGSEQSTAMICRACWPRHDYDNEFFNWTLTDIWGPVGKLPGRRTQRLEETFVTCRRLEGMSKEAQKRIADAFSAFSFRRYFTRLWVSDINHDSATLRPSAY